MKDNTISKLFFCLGLLSLFIEVFLINQYILLNRNINVDSIALNKNSISINIGNSVTIDGIISPSNATNHVIEWTSSDTSVAIVIDGTIKGVGKGIALIEAKASNGKTVECKVEVVSPVESPKRALVHIAIPTYNQRTEGYRLGCEGVSLYMALKGLGYIKDYTLDQFMSTMPMGETPFEGYVGDPTIGHDGENTGKRTTIYPAPLAKWASNYASSKDLTGASIEILKEELSQGHVVLAFVTSGWNAPSWKKYPWSKTSKGEVENNHCLCIVGYRANGDFLVNDCHDGREDGRQGEYWVSAEVFESIYNARQYAVSVF